MAVNTGMLAGGSAVFLIIASCQPSWYFMLFACVYFMVISVLLPAAQIEVFKCLGKNLKEVVAAGSAFSVLFLVTTVVSFMYVLKLYHRMTRRLVETFSLMNSP